MGPLLTNGELARCQIKFGRVRPLYAVSRWRMYESSDSSDNLTNLNNLGYLRKNLRDSHDLQCDFEDEDEPLRSDMFACVRICSDMFAFLEEMFTWEVRFRMDNPALRAAQSAVAAGALPAHSKRRDVFCGFNFEILAYSGFPLRLLCI